MIDAVMYGMIPSAKIVNRRKLPPLNKSISPSTDPWPCWNNCCSNSVLMPGVGMCPPRRYTASKPSVNSTRFRRSGVLKMFRIARTSLFIE